MASASARVASIGNYEDGDFEDDDFESGDADERNPS